MGLAAAAGAWHDRDMRDGRGGRSADGGRRVLALHGILSGAVAWAPLGRELGSGVRLIAPDLLGHGRAPRPRARYTLERVLDHLDAVVERERPTHVIGHSMGGIVALALARRWPGQFERVGVVGLPVFASRAEGRAHFDARDFPRRAFVRSGALGHAGCQAAHLTRPLWAPVMHRRLPGIPRANLMAAFDHSWASHAGAIDGIVFGGLLETLAASLETPVAAIHGDRDGAAPLGPARDLALRHGWDLTILPGANHQFVVERPALAKAWLLERVLGVEEGPVTSRR